MKAARSNDGLQVDAGGDLLVGPDELPEVALLLPGSHRVALHERVCVRALEPGVHEREQQALTEEEAVARVEVPSHSLRPHDHPRHDPGEAVEHVVEREKRVRKDDPLRRGMRDVPLVPEGNVLEADQGRGADDPRQAADALGHDRVALVRHRRRPLLPGAERLCNLVHLCPRQVADLEREALQRGGEERECRQQLGMAVPLDDLRRHRLRLEPEALAGDALDLRVDRCVVAHRAGELSDPHSLERARETRATAVELERPPGQLEAEGRRLCVDSVRPAHDQRVAVLLRPGDDRL